ncbi:helix-turn-helix domain-containing protein [Gottschalkiaceae bacterium SANA]|nr:helix-turn-helix domain-containing protein [Gottschalkiaceae bacterium SANA]
MDCLKIGELIRSLRKEKEMTQNDLANQLNISDKTISKWERGLGCPDITLIAELSEILGVDLAHMLKGDLLESDMVGGSMKNSTFYVCPTCGNITVSTGDASVSCCGRKMEVQTPQKASDDKKLNVVLEEGKWYITSNHPMAKDHYISFVAYLVGGGMQLVKLYPEWDMHLRMTKQGHGKFVWYSTKEGLFYQLI